MNTHRRIARPSLAALALACTALAHGQATAPAGNAPAPAPAPAPTAKAPAAPTFKEVPFEGTKPSAKDVLTKHVEAIGGFAAWDTRKAFASKGGIEVPAVGIKGTMETKAMCPDRVSVVMDLPGMGQTRTGFDGTTGWTIDPMRGPAIMKPAELVDVKRDANFRRDIELAKDPGKAEMAGLFSFEGHPCWLVKVQQQSDAGRVTSNFYDKETGLLSGMSMTAVTPMGAIPVIVVIGDYKDFGGVKLPTRTTTKVMGQEQVMTVDTVAWDGVADKDFELPAEIKALRDGAAKGAKDANPAIDASPADPSPSRGSTR